MYGTPQTNPEERHHYLGSLRERIWLHVTVAQAQDLTANCKNITRAMQQHPSEQLLINGKLGQTYLTAYIAAANQTKIAFTIVNDDSALTGPDDTALLIVAKSAINQPKIELAELFPPEKITHTDPEKNKSLFDKLFDFKD